MSFLDDEEEEDDDCGDASAGNVKGAHAGSYAPPRLIKNSEVATGIVLLPVEIAWGCPHVLSLLGFRQQG